MVKLLVIIACTIVCGNISGKNYNQEIIQNTENMTDSLLYRYAAYNHWANERMAEWFMNQDEKTMNMEIESSYKSLNATIKHIWGAEHGWLQVLKQEPWDNTLIKEFNGNTKDLMEAWLRSSKAFKDYVFSLDKEQINGTRKASQGRDFSVEEIIHHTMNHSTYHRGQLITMGRQAGLQQPPRTDYIYYIRL
jgi:uncharacterized damage-inducible protein DinB